MAEEPRDGIPLDPSALAAALMDAVDAGVYATDTAGRIVAVNRQATDLLARSEADLLGSDAAALAVEDGLLRGDGQRLEVEIRSVPVREAGRVTGTVVVFTDVSAARMHERRRVRLTDEREHIAETLQQSLLPAELPSDEHLRFSASFRPVGSQVLVGGDFYDAFRSGEGLMVVVGDVRGKGPEAAAVAGMVRYLLRGVARGDSDVRHALGVVHEELRAHPAQRFCTLVLAHLVRRADGTVLATIACAGHPPPLVLRADGRVEAVGGAGDLLGAFDPIRTAAEDVVLEERDTFVLFTDGLNDVGVRLGRPPFEVEEALARIGPVGGPELVTRLEDAAGALDTDELPDDVAILAVEVLSRVPVVDEPGHGGPDAPRGPAPRDPVRIAGVEVDFRETNERIREGRPPGDETLSILCECGRSSCRDLLTITRAGYDTLRADDELFAIVPGHELLEAEHVVTRHREYWVVRKTGRAAKALPDT